MATEIINGTDEMSGAEGAALACDPGGIAAEARPGHFTLARRLFTERVRERREWREGYAFCFDTDALEDVARFVANERKCCPFLSFTVEVSGDRPVWLRMTGPPGTREFLDVELPMR